MSLSLKWKWKQLQKKLKSWSNNRKNRLDNKPKKWKKCRNIFKLNWKDSRMRQQESRKKQTEDGTNKEKKTVKDIKNKQNKIGLCKRLLQIHLKHKLTRPSNKLKKIRSTTLKLWKCKLCKEIKKSRHLLTKRVKVNKRLKRNLMK